MFNGNDPGERCPLDYAFQQIGGKYKGRVLWRLHLNEVLRYNELLKMLPDASAKMLTQTLKELEEDGIVRKNVVREKPPKVVEYELADAGKELVPTMLFLRNWGEEQMRKKV